MGDPAWKLRSAIFHGDAAGVSAALAAGADPDGESNQYVPLLAACERGHLNCVRTLLLVGADPNAAEECGRTPLHGASLHGRAPCIQALLKAGANPAAVDATGWTALAQAADNGHLEATRAILAAAPETALICVGVYPVQHALYQGHLAVARCLLELGAQPPADALMATLELDTARRFGDQAVAPFFALLAACQPLTPAEWALAPWPCPGLGAALPATLARSEHEAAQLVAHLPYADKLRLRTAALCLKRMERRHHLRLPAELLRPMMLAALE